jgi:ketosteroid isomerase-like protein
MNLNHYCPTLVRKRPLSRRVGILTAHCSLPSADWRLPTADAVYWAMNANEQLIEIFYLSFQKLDAEGMVGCYHADVEFSDPAFGKLQGAEAGAMWRMLCATAKNFELAFSGVEADERTGKAHWEAQYDFSTTGRRVHNKIDAAFEFQDGKIIKHTDTFDFWNWSKQALGTTGTILGWTPLLRNKVQRQAREKLAKFIGL